jgi:PIN domain nuclease of toxin-antitoxin system
VTLLLDTHAFLWFCQDDPLLSVSAKELIEDAGNRKLLSVASCWEIAIKAGLGKLKLGEPSAVYIPAALSRTGFQLLPISLTHATAVESLPLHHREPFDRLLVVQATIEAISIVSVDVMFDSYGVSRMW